MADTSKTTAQDRRTDWIATVSYRTFPVGGPEPTLETLVQVADEMEIDGRPMGRTDRWKAAASFAREQVRTAETDGTLDQSLARWAVMQGLINLGNANF